MKTFVRAALPALLAAAFLAACGGGGDDQGFVTDDRDPTSSGRSASATVAGATSTDSAFNGGYATTDIFLNDVTKVNPVGGRPETCRFRFSQLTKTGGPQVMSGDIRYIPGNTNIDVVFISIDTVEFRIEGETPTVQVDRANNRVVFSGAVLTSTQNTGRSITLTSAIPMRPDRPEGC